MSRQLFGATGVGVEAGGDLKDPGPGVGGGEFGKTGHEEVVGGVESFFPGWCGRVARSLMGPGVCGDGGHGQAASVSSSMVSGVLTVPLGRAKKSQRAMATSIV